MRTVDRARRAAEALVPADLDSVTLTDVVSRAELLTRVDRKYVLSRSDAPTVLSELDAGTRVLTIEGTRAQSYHSVYLDTPDLASFTGAAHPRRRRFKVRTRIYVNSGTAFLEAKTRGPRGTTIKKRIDYPLDAAMAGRLDRKSVV